MKFRFQLAVLTVALALPLTAIAEESPIYESLSEVTIGRVFFSAKQRAHLDSLRGKRSTVSSSSTRSSTATSRPANPDAAGFIMRNSGKSRVYRNGDFVEVSSEPDVKFPDDVPVTRKPSAEADAKDDESN